MTRWASLAAVLLAVPSFAATEDRHCGMYPADVFSSLYAAFSDCILRDIGEKPLWRGIDGKDIRQQIRFTFTEGHSAYTRIINFRELADGTGTITLKTVTHDRDRNLMISTQKSYRVAVEDVEMLNKLGADSGNWDHPIGSWDGGADGNEIYMHCETLDMERIVPQGYSFSSVNISCNQPKKLMPLVEFIARLARLKSSADGRIY